MHKYLRYLKTVLRHKYYVGLECFKHGLYWRGIVHDLSKFSPKEFFAYAESFEGEFTYPKHPEFEHREPTFYGSLNQQQEEYDRSTRQYLEARRIAEELYTIQVKENFDAAWNRHQKLNDHHWQHWILVRDEGQRVPIKMSKAAIIELYCDWVGAGKTYKGSKGIADYYTRMRVKTELHIDTRIEFERLIYGAPLQSSLDYQIQLRAFKAQKCDDERKAKLSVFGASDPVVCDSRVAHPTDLV